MTEDVENRWATPSITHMEWTEDTAPKWLAELRVCSAIDEAGGNPILVSGDPSLHIVDDAEGRTSFWRCSVFIVFTSGPDVNTGIRMTSISMHEDGDTETSMQHDYAEQVIRHLRSTAGVRVQRV